MNESMKSAPKTVVMSGGAPQSPLMAGFLHTLWKEGRTFTRFHTSGAGALMALLFLSPSKRFKNPGEALSNWVEAGVSDEIYRVLPQNFKLFHKPGPFAPIFNRLAERFKVPVQGVPPRDVGDPVADFMAELVGPLEAYNSKLGLSLRKDPIEQFRDVWRAMAFEGPTTASRDALLKSGDPIRRLREKWLTSWLPTDESRRLYNDMVDLWFSAITPSTLSSRSLGLAAPLPFLEEIVDFGALRNRVKVLGPDAHICVNAYNMTADAKNASVRRLGGRGPRDRFKKRKEERKDVMEFFYEPFVDDPQTVPKPERAKLGKYPITADGIRAAFSMPFIYPPAKINDDFFSEGADHEPINLRHVTLEDQQEYPFVLLDVLGELEDHLVRKPRDLWDAYVISIMTPVVALANEELSDFRAAHPEDWKQKMQVVEWKIPVEAHPFVMDWSRSNLQTLFESGQEAGDCFLKDLATQGVALPKHPMAS